jgi:serine/threonine-protein kinase
MPWKSGDSIRHNVRLLRPVAKGGMGSLWSAWHEALGVEVAVKFIDERYVEQPESLERFRREAAMAARIKSPHAVQIFDHGVTDEGSPYIIMELLEGESLAQRLERTSLGLEEAARVVVQVCRALAVAHERGIFHRDIKPENIFLCDDKEGFLCKVLDFGVGRHFVPGERKLTAPGVVLGTPEYMSPDTVLSRRSVDEYVDLWSLAVVAYEMVADQQPFRGSTARDIAMRIVTKPHRAPTELRPDLPAALDAWFDRALAKDASKRFASAAELANSFVTAVDVTRPSLRFSQPVAPSSHPSATPSPARFSAPTVPTASPGAASAPGEPSRAPRSSSGRGTVRLEEAMTPTGTAVIPRDNVEQAVASIRGHAKERKVPLFVLLALVSVISVLATLAVIRLSSSDGKGESTGATSASTSATQPSATAESTTDDSASTESGALPPADATTSASASSAPKHRAPDGKHGF